MSKSGIKKVIVLGSGALKIGQAGEFDYSGSQALKALKEEGISTVLLNPNIATIQTSEGVADKVYFLPITPYFVEEVIKKEQPDGILLAFGGQTALNCGTELYTSGTLAKYGVKVLGTSVEAIMYTEDRDLFVKKLDEIAVKTPVSHAVGNLEDAVKAAYEIGFPVMIRSAYALGGMGSGICKDEAELRTLAESAFAYSPQVLVEESLKGWKEIEFEVIRDKNDHCFTVVSMENVDPLGVHTGESIVVAPTCSLTDKELDLLKELSIKTIRHLGIVGECNIQYAFNSDTCDYRVIEVNARLSRSSALASKASGYPLAFVAAKLALGYSLDEIGEMGTPNSAYKAPEVDYMIVKIPRWDLTKFVGVSRQIGSSMKSVGEIMSIGKSFEEIMQKGLRMIGQGMHGFVANKAFAGIDIDEALTHPTDKRIFVIAHALKQGYTIERIHELTRIDKWFLEKLENIIRIEGELEKHNGIADVPDELIREAKQRGFSDFQLARTVSHSKSDEIEADMLKVRRHRKERGITPVVKQIDTLGAEYPAQTNYLYVTYNGTSNDIDFAHDHRSVIVLGSGAYRIGSSVEFDWCSVSALKTIREQGYRSVMINYNPETVSTDYDVCDRLYFDELTLERVLDITDLEEPKGVVVSTGGQIPNNLAMRLHNEHVPILGTSAENIDNAEDRHKFSSMLDKIGVDQPRWRELTTMDDIYKFVDEVGFPVLIRPSYVLSGAAMNVVSNRSELEHFLTLATSVSKQYPVVVTEFIEHAKEVEIDAVAKDGEVLIYAISEHVEFAGVHSGDATMVFPPQKMYVETMRRIKKISREVARMLNISGPFNMQLMAKDNEIKVIECNLRASRSFPFVSKVLKVNFIDIATKVMLGVDPEVPHKSAFELDYVGIKAPQFSFSRLQKADPVLGVEMASTGEVGCIGEDFHEAILKAMLSVGYTIPKKNILLSTGDSRSKMDMLSAAKALQAKGYDIFATRGTAVFLETNGVHATVLHWPDQDEQPNTLTYIKEKKIDLVVNIPKNLSKDELNNDYTIRRSAIDFNIPLITNARLASAFITAFCRLAPDEIQIKSWNEY